MSRTSRSFLVLAVVLASCIWAIVTGERAQAAIGALVALASLARGSLTRASTPAQTLLMVLCGVVAVATAALFPGAGGMADRALPKAWPVIGAGALLLASARTHLERPDWGIGATLGLGLLVFGLHNVSSSLAVTGRRNGDLN